MAPRLDYVSQTSRDSVTYAVSVTYADMPANTDVVFVDTTSGAQTPSPNNALSKGGDGSAAIPINPALRSGAYYLLAQNHDTRQRIAQTVTFYIDNSTGGDSSSS